MPNLDLESLQRILALEEASLAFPATFAHDGESVPSMESLRSPTTRTLMSIRQHQNAHGWISGQFAMAQEEQRGMAEVAELAEGLLKEPLVKSYAATVGGMLHEISGARRGLDGGEDRQRQQQPVPSPTATDDAPPPVFVNEGDADSTEPHKRTSAFHAVGYTEQPGGRVAHVYGDDPDDITTVSGICFVLPKAEAGTVIGQADVPSSILSCTTAKAVGGATGQEDDDDVERVPVGVLRRTAVQQEEDAGRRLASLHDGSVDTNASAISSRDRIAGLLREQQALHTALEEQRVDYQLLLHGLERWQKARATMFDNVMRTPVPYTASVCE